jgi:hypothetical protein
MKIVCLGISWTMLFLLLLAFGFDIVDLARGGYSQTSYGQVNPLISLISYCGTQFSFFMACTAVLFLLIKKREIVESVRVMELLVTSLDTSLNIQRHLMRQKVYYFVAVSMGVICVLTPLFDPTFLSTFWDPYPYATYTFPHGLVSAYFRVNILLTIVTHYPVRSLFTYFTSFLLCCEEAFFEHNQRFLRVLQQRKCQMKRDHYIGYLRDMWDQSEKINSAFDQLQKTFSTKLLLDVSCNLGGLCIDVAWISIWILKPGLGSVNCWSLVRHLLILVVDLLCVWIVDSEPIIPIEPPLVFMLKKRDFTFVKVKVEFNLYKRRNLAH